MNNINEADYLAGVNEANYQQLLTMYQTAQKEGDELKAQVDYFKNGMAELQDYIDKMDPELLALRAQVEQLLTRIHTAERIEKIFADAPDLTFDSCVQMFPAEIAEIKAQAVTEFLAEIKRHLSKKLTPLNLLGEVDCVIVDAHATFISKLRQAAKGGE